MAVTSMWPVTSRMDKLIQYVNNPDKVEERPELSPEAITARTAVGDVIDYASNGDKTEQKMYVTGINCKPNTAAEEFMATKVRWGKTDGRLAYHGYQAFKEGPGELKAEKAHEIGVTLAKELWGDRFEIVVATHLNTAHYHNHIVINSVSLKDGKKFHWSMADYQHMKEVSDRLCREAHLDVCKESAVPQSKHYSEWSAEKLGLPTIRGKIREDINYAMGISLTEREFIMTMKEMGYEFKFHRKDGSDLAHPSLKPPGSKSFIRFERLGNDYEFDSIRRRIILSATTPGTPLLIEKQPYRKWTPPEDNLKGLPSFYRKYCIRLFGYISRPPKREYIPMALREDIVKLDHYIEQMDFLYGNKIETSESLQNMKTELQNQLHLLYIERKRLYSLKKWQKRNKKDGLIPETNQELKDISRKIQETKKKLELCDEVFTTTDRVISGANAPDKKPISQPVIPKAIEFKKKT